MKYIWIDFFSSLHSCNQQWVAYRDGRHCAILPLAKISRRKQ